MKTYQVDKNGYYGEFGGAYVPEILHQCVENLQNTYLQVLESDSFKEEFDQLLRDYVGRPSPLYLAKRLSEKYGCKIYLKREDLNHTGAHKINNTIGQILLARRMGKTRIIAETGAGQHGVATATVCALMNMECIVYMGKTDVERQHANVQKMEMLGATVVLSSFGYVLYYRFYGRTPSLSGYGSPAAIRYQRGDQEATAGEGRKGSPGLPDRLRRRGK